MADNVAVTPGTGAQIATDDVGGVQFQKVKIDIGGDGLSVPLTDATPLPTSTQGPVVDYSPSYGPPDTAANIPAQLDPSGARIIRGQVLTDEGSYRCNIANTSLAVSIGSCTFTNNSDVVTGTAFSTYDLHLGDYVYLDADGYTFAQQVDSVTETGLVLKSPYLGTGGTGASSRQIVKHTLGTGQSLGVANSVATFTLGSTSNAVAEFERDVDYRPILKRTALSISARIANQTTYVGLYDEGNGGNPRWFCWFVFDGTTNTTIKCQTARNPTTAPSAAEIQETTATLPDGLTTAVSNEYEIYVGIRSVRFYINRQIVAEHRRAMPAFHDPLTSTVRMVNGTSPAGGTTVAIDYDDCYNHDAVDIRFPDKYDSATPNAPDDAVTVASTSGNNQNFAVIDMSQYAGIYLSYTSIGGGATIAAQFSNDPAFSGTPVAGYMIPVGGGAAVTSATAVGMWFVPKQGRYCRVRTTAYTSGSQTVVINATQISPTIIPTSLTVTASNLSCNVAQWGGQTPINPTANGSTNRTIVAAMATAISNTDQSATAFAGAGRVNGTIVAAGNGGGAVITAEISISALTLGSATHIVPILQESNGGTNFTDIWTGDPVTATGIIRVPAIPVAGRRRWCMHSIGGTSTTVTVTITTLELPSGYVCQRQYRDKYSATNPLATVINNVTQTATTLVDTGATCMTATTQFTPGFIVEGTKVVTMFAVLGNGPTVTTQPVLTLQFSNDLTNWWSSTATITGAGNGTYAATAANVCFRYARIAVTTAAAYSAGNYTITAIGANGVN